MDIPTALNELVEALAEHAETMAADPDVPPDRAVAVFERVRLAAARYSDATFEASGWGSPFSEVLEDEDEDDGDGDLDDEEAGGFVDTTRLAYDPDADAAMIHVADDVPPGRAVRRIAVDLAHGTVVLDLGDSDVLLGVEVLGASRVLPAEVLGGGTDARQ
ncbi:DUF2283 domain-containing protein [Streptomyces sp. NPDC085946]|uniref:DUF2283 domain-containing protein n=1 Tax=Streptomyces sp. NPDC085946 TaxID=3365744 RepID=UPI0037D35D42